MREVFEQSVVCDNMCLQKKNERIRMRKKTVIKGIKKFFNSSDDN